MRLSLRGLLRRVRTLRISAKVSATSVVIVVFQGMLSLIGATVLITQSNLASFQGQLTRTTHSVESSIDSARSDLAVKANLLAGQQKIIDYTDYDMRNLLQQELSVMRLPLKADALCIVNSHLQQVAAVGDGRLLTAFRAQNLAANWEQGNPLFISPYAGEIHLWALSPVVREKMVIGILALGLNLDSNFINRIEAINNAAILLSWKRAIFVSGTLPDTFFEDFVKAARSAGGQESGGQTAVGRYVLSTTKIISLQGLYVHCFVDTKDSSRLLTQYRVLSLVFLLVVIGIGLATSLLLYRFTFVTPFRLLDDAIRRISAGDLAAPIAELGEDEFGDLARSFAAMTRILRAREKELADLGAYNSLVLSNVGSGILTVAFDGEITAINPAACSLLGLAPVERGRARIDAVPPELARLVEEGLHAHHATAVREVRIEIEGAVRTLSVATSPFLTQQSAPIGIIVVITDVTRVKELETKLELSSRMAAMGEMVAGVAHQIRNPLAIMKVSAELLRDHIKTSAAGDQPFRLAGMIVHEADTLGSVVSNFLDFARPYTVKKEQSRVEDLLKRVIDTLPLSTFPGNELRCEFAADLPALPLDRTLLGQVFRNLIVNALEASRPGDPVLVGAWRDDGHVVVEVRDFGPGMDEPTQKKIFNPFFTTKSDGTGLGLSIVHRIVESHGSRIEVESVPGAGTAFRVHLEAPAG